MTSEQRRCEVCGVKYAKYKCVACSREVCSACYWLQMGTCSKCSKKPKL